MAYEKQEWKNGEEGGTPITAERLNHIEEGIAVKAEQGPAGKDGAKGAKGDPGADGADGFPSEEQWNDLVARVEALEGYPMKIELYIDDEEKEFKTPYVPYMPKRKHLKIKAAQEEKIKKDKKNNPSKQ